MRRLRNIAIYYIILGIVLVLSIFLSKFWKLSIIGISLLLVYLVLRFIFKVKTIPITCSKNKMAIWDYSLYLHPILLVILILYYNGRSFNQTIVIPQGYQGVVVIDYDREDGQPDEWTGSILGIGGRLLIKTDKNGYAKTQFKYPDKSIPILNIDSGNPDLEDIKIYHENRLNTEIPPYFKNESTGTHDFLYAKLKKNNSYIAYSTKASNVRNVFVVCRVSEYLKYFYSEKEIEILNEKSDCHYSNWGNELREQYYKPKDE